jgi:hypothetical protein
LMGITTALPIQINIFYICKVTDHAKLQAFLFK